MTQKVLSYDVGGTKVAVGIVNNRGRVLEEVRVPVELQFGKDAFIDQLANLGAMFLKRHSSVTQVGVASAGPLDPKKGVLLNPTNLTSNGKHWGRVPLAADLKRRLKRPVHLENDAAAAILAEHWIGAAKKYKNAMVLTLGTGLGTGIIVNGKLVRTGKDFHPEGGHIIISANDLTAPCGCGNHGCAEAYLSGRNFARRTAKKLKIPSLTAKKIADLARKGNPAALQAFQEYSHYMAVTIYNFVRLFNPEIFIFAGSFSKTSDLFLSPTRKKLETLLNSKTMNAVPIPKLVASSLDNQSALIGAAYTLLNSNSL